MNIFITTCLIPYEGKTPIRTIDIEEEMEGPGRFIPNRWRYEEYEDFYLFRPRDTTYNQFFILKKWDFNLDTLILDYYFEEDYNVTKIIYKFLDAFVGKDTDYSSERKVIPTLYKRKPNSPNVKVHIEFYGLEAKDLFRQQFTTVSLPEDNGSPILIPLTRRKFKGLGILNLKYDNEKISVTLGSDTMSLILSRENNASSEWYIEDIEVNHTYKAKDPNSIVVDGRKVLSTLQYNGVYWIDLKREETLYYKDLISIYTPEVKDLSQEEVIDENNKTKTLLKEMILDLLKEANIKTSRLYL